MRLLKLREMLLAVLCWRAWECNFLWENGAFAPHPHFPAPSCPAPKINGSDSEFFSFLNIRKTCNPILNCHLTFGGWGGLELYSLWRASLTVLLAILVHSGSFLLPLPLWLWVLFSGWPPLAVSPEGVSAGGQCQSLAASFAYFLFQRRPHPGEDNVLSDKQTTSPVSAWMELSQCVACLCDKVLFILPEVQGQDRPTKWTFYFPHSLAERRGVGVKNIY